MRGSLLYSLINQSDSRYLTINTPDLLLLRDSDVGIVQLYLFAPVLDEQHPRGLRLGLRRSRLRPQPARADGEIGRVTKHKEKRSTDQRKQLRARSVSPCGSLNHLSERFGHIDGVLLQLHIKHLLGYQDTLSTTLRTANGNQNIKR